MSENIDKIDSIIGHMRDIADVAERYTVEELREVLREKADALATLRAAPAAEGLATRLEAPTGQPPREWTEQEKRDVVKAMQRIVEREAAEGAAPQASAGEKMVPVTVAYEAIEHVGYANYDSRVREAYAMVRKASAPAAAPAPVDGMHALISHWRSRDSGDGFDGLDYDRGVIETLLNCADDLERLLAAPTSAATPGEAAHGEQGVPDYFHVQEVAHEFGIDYNRLCAAIKALTPPAAAPGALNAAMVERASLAYEVAMDGEVYRPEVPRIAMEAALTAALAQQPPASGSRGVDGDWPAECEWPAQPFTVRDEPGEHDPCYVVMPGGGMLPFVHHAKNGVDQARARFVVNACNAARRGMAAHLPDDRLEDAISELRTLTGEPRPTDDVRMDHLCAVARHVAGLAVATPDASAQEGAK
jgi:hypothetical protein